MKTINTHKQPAAKNPVAGKQYSYSEITEFLDKHWSSDLRDTSLNCIKKLDKAFGTPSQKLRTVIITGTNGKSLTAHYSMHLLREEGLSVGAFFAPHILTYNERFVLNSEVIPNKAFTDLANEVLNVAASLDVTPHALDVLTMMALLYFSKNNVDVVLLEASDSLSSHPINICKPLVTAVTRVTNFDDSEKGKALLEKEIKQVLSIVSPQTHVVSADQSKLNLQFMQNVAEKQGAIWAMPIRKLAPLPYPFEQLHGRCAALAERVAQIFVNTCMARESVVVSSSLLTKQKGQRGRPTLEAKRQAELNPKRTLEQFWKSTSHTLAGRFQVLDKEKPSILLDTASNLDALQNVLLGIRLLHYHHPLKGLTLILGCDDEQLPLDEFLKLLRYFFKKTSGQVIVCPVQPLPGHNTRSWDAEKITNDIKSMKIKARSAKNFKEAFEAAQKSVDERYGLVVITGSPTIVTEYWRYKGMKKL